LLSACRLGFTERTGGDAGDAPGDTGSIPDGDAGVAAACGTTLVLADSFTGSTPNPQWFPYANGATAIAQSGGQFVITLPATSGSAGAYAGYDSARRYDLRGSRVYVEVPQVVSTATHAQTNLQIDTPNGDGLEITEEAGTLYAHVNVGASTSTINSMTYSPTAHLWWQIREAQGTVYFETSSDGMSFAQFATTPTPAYAQYVDIAIEAGTYQVETSPGGSKFANLNGGTPSASWCKASTLQDDFSSGTLGPQWAASFAMGGCSYAESGGDVTVTLVSGGTEECAVVSAAGYDLTGSEIFTSLDAMPAANGQIYTDLRAATANGDNVEMTVVGNMLTAAQNIGASYNALSATPYSPTSHKFWRLRESGGTLYWEAGPDGISWPTRMHSGPSPISLVGVDISIGAGTNASVASPGMASFGTFGQLPP
jgi:hypothetical protein